MLNTILKNRNILISLAISILIFTLLLTTGTAAASNQGVKVKKGWTPIPGGEANSDTDITMKNSNLAITISGTKGSTPPWGVPQGGILDGAPVVDGEIQLDRLILVDFLPDRWAGWPTTYQKVNIVTDTPEKGVVEVKRDWFEAEVVTTITLKKNDKHVHMETVLKNAKDVHEKVNSGYTLCVEGGWIDVPGGRGPRKDTLGDWMVGYNEDWAFGLHSNFHSKVEGGTTWTEQFETHTFNPGDKKTYETWLQVVPAGESSSIIDFNMEINDIEGGSVTGKVANTQGKELESPIVAAYKNKEIVGWTIGKSGKYSLNLPSGTYKLQAMAENNAPSSKKEVTLNKNEEVNLDLTDVKGPGKVNLNVQETSSNQPLDARIKLTGGPDYPIKYLGSTTKFTDLNNKGQANFTFPPATYKITVNSGAPFVSQKTSLKNVTVKSGQTKNIKAEVEMITEPNQHNWYSADLHQHSDVLDGITPPRELVQSNLAAQMDLALVSDHDNVSRHKQVKKFADKRDLPFIPSVEISPMWSHFNVYPLPIGYDKLSSDGSAAEIFKRAREIEDVVIQVNHPWISYGFYNARKNDKIPGGYVDNYDVVEVRKEKIKNSDKKTLNRMYKFWNKGKKKFIVGNTDIHDAQSTVTGYIRTFAQVKGDLTVDKYCEAVKAGNSYISRGPLLYPEKKLGQTYSASQGDFELNFTAAAAAGLKEVHVVSEGEKVRSRILSSQYVELDDLKRKTFNFDFKVVGDTWYSIIIIDKNGNHLYSNPIWVESN